MAQAPNAHGFLARAVSRARRSAVAGRVRARRVDAWRATTFALSPWFDAEWYIAEHPEVRAQGGDPLAHFLDRGERDGDDPGPAFDTDSYVVLNPAARGRALTHFHRAIEAVDHGGSLRPCDVFDTSSAAFTAGWVDPQWCAHTHLGELPELADGRPPWALLRAQGLDPSPWFDLDDYRSRMAPEHHHLDPLEHWLRVGEASEVESDLRPQVVADHDRETPHHPVLRHRVRRRSELDRVTIAAMVHAYYVDLLPELLTALRRVPGTPTILVSVTSLADAERAHLEIDTAWSVAHPRVVKVVPNRGRNFAPLLTSFTNELRDHELVVHLHTKKSLFTGTELVEWRHHLLHNLLPSPAGVDAVVSLLVPDPRVGDAPVGSRPVGIVQPAPWDVFAAWVIHWFLNRTHGARLYERLGVTDAVADGYLMFPAGGMFWARVEALEPLLALGLTVGDFEREDGQLDGTLAHSIERAVPAAAATAGFSTVELDVDAAQWRLGWSAIPDEWFGTVDATTMDRVLDEADLVSVDLFGTLLVDPVLQPSTMRTVLARRFDTATGTRRGDTVVLARFDAEAAVRADTDGDVRLDEIYDRAVATGAVSAGDLAELRSLELDAHRRLPLPRTWMIERLLADRSDHPGRRRFVLMADTELPEDVVRSLLEGIGVQDLFDRVYLSGSCRVGKDDGSMWDLVAEREQTEPARWLHIGDDERSDMRGACDRLLNFVHTPRPAAVAQRHGIEPRLFPDDVAVGTDVLVGHTLALLARRQRPVADRSFDPTEFGATILGPITLGFVHRIATSSDRSGDHARPDDDPPPVTVSGSFPLAVHDVLATVLGFESPAPTHEDLTAAICSALTSAVTATDATERFVSALTACWTTPRPDGPSNGAGHATIAIAQRGALDFVADHIDRFGPGVVASPLDPSLLVETIERCAGSLLPDLDDVAAALDDVTVSFEVDASEVNGAMSPTGDA